MVDRVLRSSQRMGHMIEDLLDVTRIRQAGGLALQLGPAHMQTLVQRTLDEVATSHPERPIDSTLAGDLVGNALHHGSADHPVRIAVDGSRPEEVSITVYNGGTIPPGLLPHLFDPFRGGEREPGRHQGLGLGLFIAHQIVRAHHGTIEARSHNDVTSFRVTLPRHAPPRPSRG